MSHVCKECDRYIRCGEPMFFTYPVHSKWIIAEYRHVECSNKPEAVHAQMTRGRDFDPFKMIPSGPCDLFENKKSIY